MGRRSVWDDQLVNELINYIKIGNYVGTACAAVGISDSTFHRWLRMGLQVEEVVSGRDDEDELKERMSQGELVLHFAPDQVRYWNFREEIIKANALSESYAVAMIRQQMPQQWTAAMTFLERRFPSRWKRREQIDHGVGGNDQAGIDETQLLKDPEAVKLIHDALDMVSRGELPIPEAEVVKEDDKAPEG